MRFSAAALLLPLSVAACQPGSVQQALGSESGTTGQALERAPSGLEQKVLTVRTTAGQLHRFTVEVARSPQEQEQGLMNRQSLAPDRGMIFPYAPPQPVSFWMKNTYIPLDMLFIRPDNSIARVETAVPLNLDPVPSLEPISAVLEIPGGRAAELGIKPGDRVSW
ncbi:DUF192 domain-containing protein [Sphingomonas sp. BN140010]|uniref:DUF192 domain-containing protein n=1 Tax=Sphingomonas arvum TaxID=2992113 RepID=A0ABT3JGL4_9SPHN|nr:DUF192 domain-containing protein [Sphingomonas sp. BN140010]MCW3798215.1 DUF192 domain-containing protein [Sphingomonas sp. BN140010]